MSRGDLVSVSVAGTRFEGRLVAAVNDLAIVVTRTIEVAVCLDSVDYIRSDRRAAFDGTNGDRSVSSFRAQLGRYEVDGTPVNLVGRNRAFNLEAVITASTDDHVLASDASGQEWALPRSAIGYAIGTTSA